MYKHTHALTQTHTHTYTYKHTKTKTQRHTHTKHTKAHLQQYKTAHTHRAPITHKVVQVPIKQIGGGVGVGALGASDTKYFGTQIFVITCF